MRTRSAKPGKQRLRIREAKFVQKHKMMSAHLTPSLSEEYGRSSVPLRKGDTVQVMRGDYAEITGKILKVDYSNGRIHIEGATREKVDGRPTVVLLHPSKLLVTKLDLDDKIRVRALERTRKTPSVGEQST